MTDKNIRGLNIAFAGGHIRITIPDAINMDNFQQVEYGIESVLTDKADKVVIDFGKTKNMFSAGFGMIVRLKKRITQNGGELYLVNVSSRVLEGMQSVGLTKIVTVCGDDEAPDFPSAARSG
jgi:anti-anti-sigma factor